MSGEQGFLDALAADAADDTTRLVYADWLEERGDDRGRYLRLEVELARLDESDPCFAALDAEVGEWARRLPADWMAAAGRRWDVWLVGYEPTLKIHVIKVIRHLTGCGLGEGKQIAESLPARVAVARSRHEAELGRQRFASRPLHGVPRAADVVLAVRPSAEPRVGPTFPNATPYELRLLGPRPGRESALIAALVSGWFWPPTSAQEAVNQVPRTLRRYPTEAEARAEAAGLAHLAFVEVCAVLWAPVVGPAPTRPGRGLYEVRLLSYLAERKIGVVRAIRDLTGVSLTTAKAWAEAPSPVVLLSAVSAAEAEEVRRAFADLAAVDVRRVDEA